MKTKLLSIAMMVAFIMTAMMKVQAQDFEGPCLPSSHGLTGHQSAFCGSILTQTIALSAGTNWVSFNVDITLDDLKAALLAANNASGIVINSQTEGITTWNGRAWRGDLNTLDVNQMYMIDVPVVCEITLESMPVDPTEHPYDIAIGSNWIGFPLSESMTLTDAFASIAVQNDQVTSQNDGFSNFNGRMWRGNLGQLVPGQGYIYDSSHQATFVFPTTAK